MKFKARPAVDQTWDFGVVNVLQFDGEGGANLAADNKNLRYIIDGLNNISFLDCSVDVRIFPESQIVNFGQISANSIATYRPKAAFSVSTIKDVAADCTEQFDVVTSFYTTDTLHDDTHLEMGNGLLMRITDQKTQEDIKFNKYKRFTTYIPGQTGAMVTRDYQAELSQKPGETLVYGPFIVISQLTQHTSWFKACQRHQIDSRFSMTATRQYTTCLRAKWENVAWAIQI